MGGWDEDSYRDLMQVRMPGRCRAAVLLFGNSLGGAGGACHIGSLAALSRSEQGSNCGLCLYLRLKSCVAPVPLQDQDDELMDDMEFEDDFDSPAADY